MIEKYKVIKAFPSATKIYQIGDFITKRNRLFFNADKFPEFLQPIERKEPYKIGDIVVIKYTGQHCYGWKGEEEKVVKISYFKDKAWFFPLKGDARETAANKYYVAFEDNTIVYTANANTDYIVRRATKEEIEEYNRIKVGGWVVVLEEDEFYSNCEKGIAQEVKEIRNTSLFYGLLFSNGSSNSYDKVRKAIAEEIEIAKALRLKKVTISNKKIEVKVDKQGKKK